MSDLEKRLSLAFNGLAVHGLSTGAITDVVEELTKLRRTNAALLAACKATSDWLLDGFFDPSELSEDAEQILETVRSAIADAEKPEKGAANVQGV